MRVKGGKALYGASVGILMLDAQFPRIIGDMGNAQTWPFPVHYKIVRQASPDKVVRGQARDMLDNFIAAGRELIADGVDGITTNCGFLALYQEQLSQALQVPVATSSLLQVQMVNSLLPKEKQAGILTISASSLTPAHLRAANVPETTPVATTEGGAEFTHAILDNENQLDIEAARLDNIAAARQLCQDPSVGAIVLECTNMIPYAAAIHAATGLPVFSIYNFILWFQASLSPKAFPLPPMEG